MTKTKQQSGAKDRILEAADRLFYEQGYHKTGVNQLIDEAQVAKASFYSHFSSKRKLLKAYLKQRHTHWFEDLHEVVNAYNDPEQKIVGLFEYLEKWIKETDYRGCAFININTELPDDDGEITSIVQGHKQELRDLVDSFTSELNQNGRSDREVDLQLLSDTIYLIFEGAIIESQNYRKIWPVKRSLEAVKQLL